MEVTTIIYLMFGFIAFLCFLLVIFHLITIYMLWRSGATAIDKARDLIKELKDDIHQGRRELVDAVHLVEKALLKKPH